MASAAISKLAERASRAKTRLSNYKVKAKLNERRMLSKGEVVIGGVLGGAIDAWQGEPGAPAELLGMPAVALGGAILTVIGISDLVPGAEDIASLGAGALSYSLGTYAREKIEEAEK